MFKRWSGQVGIYLKLRVQAQRLKASRRQPRQPARRQRPQVQRNYAVVLSQNAIQVRKKVEKLVAKLLRVVNVENLIDLFRI